MSTLPPDFSAPIINGFHEVAGRHLGKSLVNVFLDCFSIGDGKVRDADYLLSRSRTLIRQHYEFMPTQDQDTILHDFRRITNVKAQLNSARGSMRQRFSLAKDYKKLAEHLFILVETASSRADGESLLDQISRANAQRASQPTAPPPAPPPPAFGTTTNHTDPFSDSHEAAPLADCKRQRSERSENVCI